MSSTIHRRRADFERRASFSPGNVYTHRRLDVSYIPVHAFADDLPAPGSAPAVDGWCRLPTDVALVETRVCDGSTRGKGIWIRRDAEAPQFLKVHAFVDGPSITRSMFESVIEEVMSHPSAAGGFAEIAPGSGLKKLS